MSTEQCWKGYSTLNFLAFTFPRFHIVHPHSQSGKSSLAASVLSVEVETTWNSFWTSSCHWTFLVDVSQPGIVAYY